MKRWKTLFCICWIALILGHALPEASAESGLKITWPTAEPIRVWDSLSSSALTDGSAVGDDGTAVPGSFAWEEDGETFTVAGDYSRGVVFTPEEGTGYAPVTGRVVVTVYPFAVPSESDPPTGSPVARGSALASSRIAGTMCDPRDGTPVTGAFIWADGSQILNTGGHTTASALFIPDKSQYPLVDAIALSVPVTVWFPALVTAQPEAGELWTNQALSQCPLTGGRVIDPVNGQLIPGTWEWSDPQWTSQTGGIFTLTAVFVPEDEEHPVDVECSVSVTVTVPRESLTIQSEPYPAEVFFPGDDLYAVALTGWSVTDDAGQPVEGTFQWAPGQAVPASPGQFTALAVFQPKDSQRYEPVTVTLTLTALARTLSNSVLPEAYTSQYIQAYFGAGTLSTTLNPGVMLGSLLRCAVPGYTGPGTETEPATPVAGSAGEPVILSAPLLPSFTVGQPYTYRLESQGTQPLSWSAQGLPDWLDLEEAGVLTGTPDASGLYYGICLTAENRLGPVTVSFRLAG